MSRLHGNTNTPGGQKRSSDLFESFFTVGILLLKQVPFKITLRGFLCVNFALLITFLTIFGGPNHEKYSIYFVRLKIDSKQTQKVGHLR